MYRIIFTREAQQQLLKLQRSVPQAMKKLQRILVELREHPRSGTGQIEQLRHYQEETWSRRLTREHRIVYRICEDRVEILVLAVWGHYNDK